MPLSPPLMQNNRNGIAASIACLHTEKDTSLRTNLMYRLAGRYTPHMSVHIFSARNTMVLKVSFKSRGVDYKTSRKRKLSGKGAV